MTYTERHKRGHVVDGKSYKIGTGCGSIYVNINKDVDGRIVEIFANLGKSGGCVKTFTEVIGRLASLALQLGGNPQEIIEQLLDHSCPNIQWHNGEAILSCPHAMGIALKQAYNDRSNIEVAEVPNEVIEIEESNSGKVSNRGQGGQEIPDAPASASASADIGPANGSLGAIPKEFRRGRATDSELPSSRGDVHGCGKADCVHRGKVQVEDTE